MAVSHDSIRAYMNDVSSIPLLSAEEEIELADLISRGSEEARHKLIRSNLRLVVKIAHDFRGLGLPLIDLVAEGNIGLMRAVDKFDPAKGAKFSSYASWWIKQSIRRALSNQSRTIRIPVQTAAKLAKVRATRERLKGELSREPSATEIAEDIDLSKRTVKILLASAFRSLSLQDALQPGEEGQYKDVIADDSIDTPEVEFEHDEVCNRLYKMLERLDEREQMIIVKRFGLDGARPQTLQQLSKKLDRTRERVRQIQYRALEKLKKMLKAEEE